MRSARILLIGTAALLAALLFRFWARWAVLAFASLPLAFIIIGQFYLPQSKQSIRLWMNPDILEDLDEVSLRLSGKEVLLGFFKRWYEFEIDTYNLCLLVILGLASMAALAAVWMTKDLPIPGSGLYYAGSAWSLVCYLAWRWLWERKAMREAGLALGSFYVAGTAGPLLKRVVYRFRDDTGEYRGGSFRSLFCDTKDDLTVIFYDEHNPEVSVPASAMIFHKLRWAEPIRTEG